MKIRIERECTSIGVPVDGNEVHFGGLAFHNSRHVVLPRSLRSDPRVGDRDNAK